MEVKDYRFISKKELAEAHRQLMIASREYKIWLVFGTAHFAAGSSKPYNALYVYNPEGRRQQKYFKKYLTPWDKKHYRPGNANAVFNIKGIKCGLSICYDIRFPELYREYFKKKVNLMFYASYQAGKTKRLKIMRSLAAAMLQTRASENNMLMLCSNAVTKPMWFPSMVIRNDGFILKSLKADKEGILIQKIQPQLFPDDFSKNVYKDEKRSYKSLEL